MAPTAAPSAGNVEGGDDPRSPPPPPAGPAAVQHAGCDGEDSDQPAEPPPPPPASPAPVQEGAEEGDQPTEPPRAPPAAPGSGCRGTCGLPGPPECFGVCRGCLYGGRWDRGRRRRPVPQGRHGSLAHSGRLSAEHSEIQCFSGTGHCSPADWVGQGVLSAVCGAWLPPRPSNVSGFRRCCLRSRALRGWRC